MSERPDSGQLVVVLDNCVLNDILVRNPSGHLSEGIRVAVARQQMAVWTLPYLIYETVAGGEANRSAARTKLAFLQAVSGGHMLKYSWDLLSWEAVHGFFPSGEDRFLPRDKETEIYDASLAACDRGGIVFNPVDGSERPFRDLVYEQKRAGQRDWLERIDVTREAIIQAFEAAQRNGDVDSHDARSLPERDGEVDFCALGGCIRNMPSVVFAGWVAVQTEQYGNRRTVTEEDLSLFPYTGSAAGYRLAKIVRNYETGYKGANNDSFDVEYCIAASQADMLVTSDADLKKTCALMPHKSFGVGGVEDLEDLLVLAASSRRLKQKT
ncbi:hypothetical protein SMC7_01940 [Candidatus Cryosericum terrychapinii]|uniref:Uncharacterized protein n=1 Tax=Candidatus Cryosericum terrychapinii TaxID=2290919 RepID=A0A398CV11_9BACT|nr:hypothetical protein SMC7_01940 [Candidatus Cryosericum terrychapinii]